MRVTLLMNVRVKLYDTKHDVRHDADVPIMEAIVRRRQDTTVNDVFGDIKHEKRKSTENIVKGGGGVL